MAKGTRGRRGIASRQCRPTPYPSYHETRSLHSKRCSKLFKKDWEDATCSVCMEYPHNAVLLLCSSHEKGCRPYMCGTSFRYSNCLDQFKKAYAKVTSTENHQHHDSSLLGRTVEHSEATELACPLCRGQVKGWTVVEPARVHLNAKRRSCMQENCTFTGTFKELRKHMKAEHPLAKPREVDPNLEQKWRRMEREREREDVMSTIRSSMPGAVFFGDYVIEGGQHDDLDSDDEDNFNANVTTRNNEGVEVEIDRNLMSVFLFLQAFGSAGNVAPNGGTRERDRDINQTQDRGRVRFNRGNDLDAYDYSDQDSDDSDDNGNGNNHMALAGHFSREDRVRLGRLRRRRRRRETNEDQR